MRLTGVPTSAILAPALHLRHVQLESAHLIQHVIGADNATRLEHPWSGFQKSSSQLAQARLNSRGSPLCSAVDRGSKPPCICTTASRLHFLGQFGNCPVQKCFRS